MTSIHDRQLLELYPDTITSVRKIYNLEDPNKMQEAIDILERWVEMQNHFLEKKCPRRYLETNIINNKGSIEKTKSKLDKLFTLRTLFPKLYNFNNIKDDFKHFHSCVTVVPLPKLTEDHYRVISLTIHSNEIFLATPLTTFYIMYSILFEYLKMYDYNNGCILVADLRNINIMDLIAKLNMLELKQFTTMILVNVTVLIVASESGLQTLIVCTKDSYKSQVLRLNSNKTEVVVFERSDVRTDYVIMVNDESLKQIDGIVYLGSLTRNRQ